MTPRTKALGAVLALLAAGSAGGTDTVRDFETLQAQAHDELRGQGLWPALRLADRSAAIPGLTDSQRADAFGESGKIRVLLGDQIGAERDFKRSLQLRPGDAEVSYRLAQVTRDRPQEALGYAEQAAHSAGTARRKADAQRLSGEIRLDAGDAAGARSSLQRAVELNGGDLDALWDLVRLQRDHPAEASADAERAFQAAEAAPLWDRPAAYRLAAQIWLELKNSERAMESVGLALALEPDDLDALRTMKKIGLERHGAPAAAGERAPRAAAGEPDELETLREAISAKRAQKKKKEAVALADRFDEAAADAPAWQQPDAYRLGAQIWLGLGDERKARHSVMTARDLGWRSIKTEALAYAMAHSGKNRLGAASNGPLLADAYFAAAQAHAELDDRAGAERCLKHAAEIAPDQAATYPQLLVKASTSTVR